MQLRYAAYAAPALLVAVIAGALLLASDTGPQPPTYALTTSATENGGVSPLPGTYTYLDGESVTVTATPDEGYRVSLWSGDCSGTATTCVLTLDADRTASVTFERITHTLTVTATGDGSVTPAGTTTHDEGDEATLTATWSDATHDFDGWGGDCSGTASTCVLTMDANKSVTATFIALPTDRCAESTDADCIRAVYLGAPGDYAEGTEIPADILLTPAADGRYYAERGQQLTVVTAGPLPVGYTRFYLERTPLGRPSPLSFERLIPPLYRTYTVTTVFSVDPTTFYYDTFDTTGEVTAAGSYAFLKPDGDDSTSAVTTYEELRDGTTTGLLVHQSDAHGTSQAGFYDTVETGDVVEWREADQCWVRYRITATPASTLGATRAFGIARVTYAATGCTGAANWEAAPTATLEWSPPNVQTKDPTTFYYDTFDTTGEVTAAGSYAFLKPDGDDSTSAVTTYEELRDGTTTSLLVNKSDAHGASQAGFYDTVETGDVVEWREADQCWVRYRITATPASTLGATRAFGIAWVTYAATGCTGAANWAAAPTATLEWSPPNVQTPDVTSPIRHGPFLLIPRGWDGVLGARQPPSPIASREASRDSGDPPPVWPSFDIEEIRRHPLWNEPDIPEGWYLYYAEAHTAWIQLLYRDCCGDVEIQISQGIYSLPIHITYVGPNPVSGLIWEAREIDGHPAVLHYTPTNDAGWGAKVLIYDVASDIRYTVLPTHWWLIRDHEAVIAIARSLYD